LTILANVKIYTVSHVVKLVNDSLLKSELLKCHWKWKQYIDLNSV